MTNERPLPYLHMMGCATIIGVAVGLSVVILIKFLAFIHNLFFLGKFDFFYNELLHTAPGPFGIGIILVPVIGSLIVTFILKRFAFDERGLSVSEIIYNIHFKEGHISPVNALAKTIASMISIGTGGSLGREGPLVQLGAAYSAIIGSFIQLSAQQRIVLIAAGSAAGTAAVFNAPIGGLLFVIEILLVNINVSAIVLIIIAEIFALLIKWIFFERLSFFLISDIYHILHAKITFTPLILCIPFGFLLGILGILFIRGLYWSEDFFNAIFKNAYLRHACGMFIIGIMFYMLMQQFGHYYIEGIGYSTIEDVLNFKLLNPWLLALLLLCKCISTFITLGSGATGGIFSPSLFIGALLGGLMCILCQHFFDITDAYAVSFVIAGMAGMLGSVTGGVMTAIVLCIEITQNYQYILPIFITVTVSYITRKKWCRESAYTMKLIRRKVDLTGLDSA